MEATDTLRNIVRDELKEVKEELKIIRSMIENFIGYEELTEEELREVDEAEMEIESGKGLSHNEVKRALEF